MSPDSMSPHVLLGVVVLQVSIFQLAAQRLARTLPDLMAGAEGLSAAAASDLERMRRRAGRRRRLAGAALILAALLSTYALPTAFGHKKLALGVISILSSAIFAAGATRDRRSLRSFARSLPEPPWRAASLEKRTIARYYSPGWELVPVAIFLATAGITLGLADGGTWSLPRLITPIVQGALIPLFYLQTVRMVRSGSCVVERSWLSTSPAEAVGVAERLRSLELRFFMAAKIGIALLLATVQLERLMVAASARAPAGLGHADRVVLAAMLALFAGYLFRVSRVRRGARAES